MTPLEPEVKTPAYMKRREKAWAEAGILFLGRPLPYPVFEALVEFQGYRCAVCGMHSAFESLAADHDHKTRELRGALDMRCNHRRVGVVERYGRYRSARVTRFVKEYLRRPPARKQAFMDLLRLKGLLP